MADLTAAVAQCFTDAHHKFSKAYDPNQPRKPKGQPDGGQFADMDGVESVEITDEERRDYLYDELAEIRERSLTRDLTYEEAQVLTKYTQTSKELNNALRQGRIEESYDTELLDDAISVSRLKDEVTVYRGFSTRVFDDLKPGAILEDRGYVSTSYDKRMAQEFALTRLVTIHLPKGANALPISQYSQFPDEMEVLLPRGSKFKVIKAGAQPVLELMQ